MPTRTGRVLGGRYRIADRLGGGAYGQVWRARDERLDVDVAVKEVWLPPSMSQAEQAERLARAAREARNAARLRDHPNVVAVLDVVVEDGVPWTVMQLVAGVSLAEHVARHGPLPVDRAAEVARCLLDALGAAHAAGIVHRDVKPGNVLLATTGEVLLTDFGIAVSRTDDAALTATGTILGSVPYLAPERAQGQRGGPASDLFSLGATLYAALEGASPFQRQTTAASLFAVVSENPPPPPRAGRLAPLVARLLNKDPDRRPTVPQAQALLTAPSEPDTEFVGNPTRDTIVHNGDAGAGGTGSTAGAGGPQWCGTNGKAGTQGGAGPGRNGGNGRNGRNGGTAGTGGPGSYGKAPPPRLRDLVVGLFVRSPAARARARAGPVPWGLKGRRSQAAGWVALVAVALAFLVGSIVYNVYTRDPHEARAGDCVYGTGTGSALRIEHKEPCSPRLPGYRSFQVLLRIDPGSGLGCAADAPGWSYGDISQSWEPTATVAPMTLCLRPLN